MFSFRKSPQEKLNEGFLKAVERYELGKAKALLVQGAHVMARDKNGNTALHMLARGNPFNKECSTTEWLVIKNLKKDYIADFILFLQKADPALDINITNNLGQTCLHLAAQNGRDKKGELSLDIFYKLGARTDAVDKEGHLPLYFAGKSENRYLLNFYLTKDDSSVREQQPKHEEAVAAPMPVPVKAAAEESADVWAMPAVSIVTRTSRNSIPGYKVTEIFNFAASERSYTKIARNLETNAEALETKGFDEFSDKTLLEQAYAEFTRAGGKADKSIIDRPDLGKKSKL
jgi:hypothetical protein